MTTPADIIATVVVLVDGYESLTIGDVGAQDAIIAALDAAGYTIVARDPRPATCPTCGSDRTALRNAVSVGLYSVLCPDPWHRDRR